MEVLLLLPYPSQPLSGALILQLNEIIEKIHKVQALGHDKK